MLLWIDDLRPAPEGWHTATQSREAINWLEWARMLGVQLEAVSFDHDLGGDDTTRPVVIWFCETGWWPEKCYIHSANPVGREWLAGMIDRYGPGVSR